jgi:integrase
VKVGIDKLAPHDLRRTCAMLCHTAGGQPEQIRFLLGHVSANSEQPQRKIARASLPAVNYTTTERAVYFAFFNSAKE